MGNKSYSTIYRLAATRGVTEGGRKSGRKNVESITFSINHN